MSSNSEPDSENDVPEREDLGMSDSISFDTNRYRWSDLRLGLNWRVIGALVFNVAAWVILAALIGRLT
jgi:hypothetical protein